MRLNPQEIEGPWDGGVVLDWHTSSSIYLGNDGSDRSQFHNEYTDIGNLLRNFKYRNDTKALNELLSVACGYLGKAKVRFDVVVPIPPSKPNRSVTAQLAIGLAQCLNSEYPDE